MAGNYKYNQNFLLCGFLLKGIFHFKLSQHIMDIILHFVPMSRGFPIFQRNILNWFVLSKVIQTQ